MAAPIYCTHKELKRVFPQLDSFDGKKPVYGWTLGLENWFETSLDLYYAHNTGLIHQLYIDGIKCSKKAFPSETTQVATQMGRDSDTLVLDAHSGIEADDIIRVGTEYMKVVSVNTGTNTLTISSQVTNRGLFGTASVIHNVDESVYLVYDANVDSPDASAGSPTALKFVYDSALDLCLLNTEDLNPADFLVEAGEDFTTLVTQFRTDASRYLDSMLDPNMPKEAWKDKTGAYDYIIIRTTALIAANFMIKSHDPNSELANALMEEANQNIENINQGKAALSWQVTRDSAQGVVRDVVYNTAGAIRPVDTRGEWHGTYDLIKVIITVGGALGTSKYEVYTKDSTKLKNQLAQSATVISGDYQPLAGGLEIRFAGSSNAIADDEWEIECFGKYEDVDASSGRSVKMTRTRKTSYRRYETE
tara:strand:+ start:59 stop:1315 length:1257 start_codon:yes stop_codon:yes gene_type:complete